MQFMELICWPGNPEKLVKILLIMFITVINRENIQNITVTISVGRNLNCDSGQFLLTCFMPICEAVGYHACGFCCAFLSKMKRDFGVPFLRTLWIGMDLD